MTETSNTEQPGGPPPSPWARTALWLGLVFILVAGMLFAFKSCVDAPKKVVQQTSDLLSTLAAAFNRGAVNNSFVSYATSITNNLHLQIATLDQMEMFTRQEESSTGFGYISLPDVVVEARAPVQFTYYLDLNAEWRFVLRDEYVYVFAPPIQFNKPSVDVSDITYEVKRGFLKTDDALDRLKRSISALVGRRARFNIHLIRETGRRQTTEFVQNWLMRAFSDGTQYPVKVIFADETMPPPFPVNGPRLESPAQKNPANSQPYLPK